MICEILTVVQVQLHVTIIVQIEYGQTLHLHLLCFLSVESFQSSVPLYAYQSPVALKMSVPTQETPGTHVDITRQELVGASHYNLPSWSRSFTDRQLKTTYPHCVHVQAMQNS